MGGGAGEIERWGLEYMYHIEKDKMIKKNYTIHNKGQKIKEMCFKKKEEEEKKESQVKIFFLNKHILI